MRQYFRSAGLVLVAVLLVSIPGVVGAGSVGTGGKDDDKGDPGEDDGRFDGETTVPGGGPITFSCPLSDSTDPEDEEGEPTGNVDFMIENTHDCVASAAASNGYVVNGDFDHLPSEKPPEFQIFKLQHGNRIEPEYLCYEEDNARVQSTLLRLVNPSQRGRIGMVTETPSEGSIFITVNSTVVEIETDSFDDAEDLNEAIFDALDAEFDAYEDDTSWVVVAHTISGDVQRIGFRSTDDAITVSKLSLEPHSEFYYIPPCFE